MASKGAGGVIMKLWRSDDYTITVTSTRRISDHYVRLGFKAGGILEHHPVHPTQWIRLWVPDTDGNKLYQRGYTLVDQDPANDAFDIEFALHSGRASIWARNAKSGDTIEASVLGSKFELPATTPSEYVMFGDTASLPAINSLLDAIGDTPARVWLESQYDDDTSLPVHAGANHEITWVERIDDGRLLREAAMQASIAPTAYGWVTCDGNTTRSIVKTLRGQHALPKTQIHSQAYWK